MYCTRYRYNMHYHTAGDVCYEDVAVKVNASGTDGKLSYIMETWTYYKYMYSFNIHYYTAGDKQVVFYEDMDVKVNTSGTAGK